MMIKRIYINFVFPYKIILNKILFYINKKFYSLIYIYVFFKNKKKK